VSFEFLKYILSVEANDFGYYLSYLNNFFDSYSEYFGIGWGIFAAADVALGGGAVADGGYQDNDGKIGAFFLHY
jgi:hypothetical protein